MLKSCRHCASKRISRNWLWTTRWVENYKTPASPKRRAPKRHPSFHRLTMRTSQRKPRNGGFDTVEVCIDLERFGDPVPMDGFIASEAARGKSSLLNMTSLGWSNRKSSPLILTLPWQLVISIPRRSARTLAYSSTPPRTAGAGCSCSAAKTRARGMKSANRER